MMSIAELRAMNFNPVKHVNGPRRRPRHDEDNLQTHCVRWFRLQYPNKIIFAIPNGGKRNAREAGRMKAQGVTAGVSDLFIPEPNIAFHGLWIELKAGKNTLTPSQKEFIEQMKSRGYRTAVCRSLEQFIETVGWYLAHAV